MTPGEPNTYENLLASMVVGRPVEGVLLTHYKPLDLPGYTLIRAESGVDGERFGVEHSLAECTWDDAAYPSDLILTLVRFMANRLDATLAASNNPPRIA